MAPRTQLLNRDDGVVMLTALLTKVQRRKLKRYARKQKVSMSIIVRRLIEEHIPNE